MRMSALAIEQDERVRRMSLKPEGPISGDVDGA